MNLYRHGDLALTQIKELPTGLKEADTRCVLTGSHGNDHTVHNGTLYLKDVDQYVFGYLVAGENTYLDHEDHGKLAITPGVYELRKQHEETNDGMKEVVD